MQFSDEKAGEIQGSPVPVPAPVTTPPARLDALAAHTARPNSWFERNLGPIAVLGGCLLVLVLSGFLRLAIHGNNLSKPESTVNAPVLDETMEQKVSQTPVMQVRGAMVLVSVLGCIGLAANALFFRNDRRALDYFFAPAPPRVQPAVRTMDVLAALGVTIAAGGFFASLVIPGTGISAGEYTGLVMLCGTAGMCVAVVVLVQLAIWRAKGAHGAEGLFPFWTLSRHAPLRSLAEDAKLAVLVYLLTSAPLLYSGALNKWLVKKAGMPPDQHTLIGELLLPQPVWVTAAFLFSATIGAAFTEEILFRGGLLNACRRWMKPAVAWLVAGLLFSAVHFIRSDFIPLFLMGLIMTWLYERTGRLFASMVFHFANNFVSVVTVLALRPYL